MDFTVLQSCRISRVALILQAPHRMPLSRLATQRKARGNVTAVACLFEWILLCHKPAESPGLPPSSKLPVERSSGRQATRRKGRGNFTAIACLNGFYSYNPEESPGLPSPSKLLVECLSGTPATRRKGRGNFTAVACLNGFYCVTILQNVQGCPHPPSSWLNVPRVGKLRGGKAEVISQPLPA